MESKEFVQFCSLYFFFFFGSAKREVKKRRNKLRDCGRSSTSRNPGYFWEDLISILSSVTEQSGPDITRSGAINFPRAVNCFLPWSNVISQFSNEGEQWH